MQGFQVDLGLVLGDEQEQPALAVLEEQVLGLAALDPASEKLRFRDGEHRRMIQRLVPNSERVQKAEQIRARRRHEGHGLGEIGRLP